ncbi:unnamed protein product [Pneumocystis jirovecii]|uniref:Arrestin C-terminal-like domain-containing protein n=1 Tax=Pneumocystis jirovecii TaxID=42068 RepID=L0PEH2_PNEJI|nr:unnamed protein product [Pneumocystis jirovecii]
MRQKQKILSLKGSVVFSLNDSITVKSIIFRFYGVNKVKWTEVVMSSAKTPIERNQKQKSLVFEKEISFLPFQGTKTIGKGNYEYPFEIVIPGNIHESIEPYQYDDSMGYLIYKIKVIIERPGFLSNIVHKKHIRIIRTIPLSFIDFIHTMFVEDTWLNKIEYNINIPTKIYEFGGLIPVNMRFIPLIKNLKLAKISFFLKEYITLRIISGYYGMPSKYDTTRQISSFKIKNLPENVSEWKLEETIKIPNSLSSCIQNCDVKHIKVRHKLKVIITLINPDGHISELRASLPIVLLISPALFTNIDDYAYPLSLGLQLPSYNNHIYDPVWDGISSIHTYPMLNSQTAMPLHSTNDSAGPSNLYTSDSLTILNANSNRHQTSEESDNTIQNQENENNSLSYSSGQHFTASTTPDTTSPDTSIHHAQSQQREDSEYHETTITIPSISNRQPLDITRNPTAQSTSQARDNSFIENLSRVPPYHIANRPISTTITPISKSLPTYEASICLSLQNINETLTSQCPEQTLRQRLDPLKHHTNRFFKIFFIQHHV